MRLAVLRERKDGERRVAATPEMVRKYLQSGVVELCVESGAGIQSGISDEAYTQAGAQIAGTALDCVKNAHITLCVQAPPQEVVSVMAEGALLVGMLDPYRSDELLPTYSEKRLTTFALELLPRISRAQSMDVLSSQSNLAGYRAVIEAVNALSKAVPMMMTAAGTIAPAKALILGAGVAGLQAIATAKRLGAVVSAFDVRPAVKEQVESLGAKFIEVPAESANAETKGGYAREMSEEYKAKQSQLIHDTIIKQDFVITTALIPGKPAPVLITEAMVREMKPGSVIVDLAVSAGGNCPLSEYENVVVRHGIILIGYSNLPSHVAADASALYARNVFNFVGTLLVDKNTGLSPKWEDELITGAMLTKEGHLVHTQFRG